MQRKSRRHRSAAALLLITLMLTGCRQMTGASGPAPDPFYSISDADMSSDSQMATGTGDSTGRVRMTEPEESQPDTPPALRDPFDALPTSSGE